MLKNTASAEKFIVVVGIKVVLAEDLLFLCALGVGLEERVEPVSGDFLGRKFLVVSGTGLRTAIAH